MEARVEGRSGRMVMGVVLAVLQWKVLEWQLLVNSDYPDPHCLSSG